VFSARVFGQATAPQAHKPTNGLKYGFSYLAQYKLNPDWGIQTEVQSWMDENLDFPIQNVYLLGLMRYLKPNLGLSAGYSQAHTHSEPFEDYFTDHRIFEQLLYLKREKRHAWVYRFRLEQRFVEKLKFAGNGEVVTDHYLYGNRLRLFNRYIFDLTKDPEAENVFYLAAQDEVFLNINAPEINPNFFDQNRFFFGVGIYKNKHTRLEMDYINFLLNPGQGENTMIHTLGFAVIQNLVFGKKE
jgi:hypothetical protein